MHPGNTVCAALLLIGVSALLGPSVRAAEFFYLDHDLSTKEYTGPVGPLVVSGEIEAGDYPRLLAKIAEQKDRFLAERRMIAAVNDGDVAETIKIADLVRATFTEVIVEPLTGRCVGACFLIFAAAGERGTNGSRLLGLHRPPSDHAPPPSQPGAERARAYLEENAVPGYLIEQYMRHAPDDVYWLSQEDEANLGAKSAAFAQLLAAKCGWSEALEHAVYRGEKPMDDLNAVLVCRDRLIRPAASYVLETALKESAAAAGRNVEEKAVACPKKKSVSTKADACAPSKAAGAAPGGR